MPYPHGYTDPPPTLAERLTRLNDHLQGLDQRLKAAIGAAVGSAIATAVRDAVRYLLGGKDTPAVERQSAHHDYRDDRAYRDERAPDSWGEEDSRWPQDEEFFAPASERPATRNTTSKRWCKAMSAALQMALWWLKHQPGRRPILTTVTITLAAGITAWVAGPAIAAGVGVLTSVAGLLLTSNAASEATNRLADVASD